MSIVSHTVTTSPQSATRMNAHYAFTDHVGGVHSVRKLVSNTFDTEADALAMYDRVAEGLVSAEEQAILGMVENGEDIQSTILNPVHSTTKELVKKAIRYMMRERNPYIVIALEPLINYLRANYTGAQLITFLDITSEQATKMNNRINAILDNKSAFTTFDSNAEEIE